MNMSQVDFNLAAVDETLRSTDKVKLATRDIRKLKKLLDEIAVVETKLMEVKTIVELRLERRERRPGKDEIKVGGLDIAIPGFPPLPERKDAEL